MKGNKSFEFPKGKSIMTPRYGENNAGVARDNCLTFENTDIFSSKPKRRNERGAAQP